MYQAVTTAFDQNNVGQAAAITVVFFLIVVALTLIQRRVVRPEQRGLTMSTPHRAASPARPLRRFPRTTPSSACWRSSSSAARGLYLLIGSLKPSDEGTERPVRLPAHPPVLRQLLQRPEQPQLRQHRLLLALHGHLAAARVRGGDGWPVRQLDGRVRAVTAEVARPQRGLHPHPAADAGPVRVGGRPALLHVQRPAQHALHPGDPVHRQRLLGLPVPHLLPRDPAGASRKPPASTARAPGARSSRSSCRCRSRSSPPWRS